VGVDANLGNLHSLCARGRLRITTAPDAGTDVGVDADLGNLCVVPSSFGLLSFGGNKLWMILPGFASPISAR
jgi:hypothetical protein